MTIPIGTVCNPKMKKIILICIVLSVTSFIFYKAITNGYIRMNYPSFEKYPIHGIDVSHHQHQIDWDKLDKKYVQFAFIKSTEGATHQDSRFTENWESAKRLNIPVAAYHFFTFCTSGVDQAQNFINTVPNDSTSLPPTIDLEYGGNCKEENRVPNLQSEIEKFIQIIEDYYNKKVIIYTTKEFYANYIANKYPNNPIWIRNITCEPQLEREWIFWQYANRGRLDGIDTFVDINTFYRNKEELNKLQNSYITNKE